MNLDVRVRLLRTARSRMRLGVCMPSRLTCKGACGRTRRTFATSVMAALSFAAFGCNSVSEMSSNRVDYERIEYSRVRELMRIIPTGTHTVIGVLAEIGGGRMASSRSDHVRVVLIDDAQVTEVGRSEGLFLEARHILDRIACSTLNPGEDGKGQGSILLAGTGSKVEPISLEAPTEYVIGIAGRDSAFALAGQDTLWHSPDGVDWTIWDIVQYAPGITLPLQFDAEGHLLVPAFIEGGSGIYVYSDVGTFDVIPVPTTSALDWGILAGDRNTFVVRTNGSSARGWHICRIEDGRLVTFADLGFDEDVGVVGGAATDTELLLAFQDRSLGQYEVRVVLVDVETGEIKNIWSDRIRVSRTSWNSGNSLVIGDVDRNILHHFTLK